jgi:hypothetical protein
MKREILSIVWMTSFMPGWIIKTRVLKKPLMSMRAGPPADVRCGRMPLAITT